MPTAVLEVKYLKLLKTNPQRGSDTGHTIVMIHVWAKYQVICVPTGPAYGVKSITSFNHYGNHQPCSQAQRGRGVDRPWFQSFVHVHNYLLFEHVCVEELGKNVIVVTWFHH